MKRRVISMLLCLCMVLSLAVMAAPGAEAACYAPSGWVGAWSTSPVRVDPSHMLNVSLPNLGLSDLSFRTTLQPTISGSAIRITLSNQYGSGPITVNAVTVARGMKGLPSSFRLGTDKKVTFSGKSSVTIPVGKTVTSDPISMSVGTLEYITVTSYMKKTNHLKTYGLIGGDTYVAVGDRTKYALPCGVHMNMTGDTGEFSVIPLISDVEVYHPGAASVVVLGDSTIANDIPILLAQKLKDNGITDWGVLQQAIKGNRLLADGAGTLGDIYGESIEHRLNRDALNQPGVKAIILKVGANDFIHPHLKSNTGKVDPVTTQEMINGYTRVIQAAHAKGIKVYMCTRTAWNGYTRNLLGIMGDDINWTPELDVIRKEVNEWIRSSACPADAVIELDSLCQDAEATTLKAAYTTDGAHLTAAGQKALVELIPVKALFG